jgi:hypothetical protein
MTARAIQHLLWLLAALTAFFTAASVAAAQDSPPFFGGGAVAFDVQVSSFDAGPIVNAHVAVSSNRKYVTIGEQASDSKLLALSSFNFQSAGPTGGFVGMPTPVPAAMAAAKSPATPARPSILDKPGMTLISPLVP